MSEIRPTCSEVHKTDTALITELSAKVEQLERTYSNSLDDQASARAKLDIAVKALEKIADTDRAKLGIAVKALKKIAHTDNGHLAPGFGADSRAIGMLEGLIMAGKEAKKALVQITGRSK